VQSAVAAVGVAVVEAVGLAAVAAAVISKAAVRKPQFESRSSKAAVRKLGEAGQSQTKGMDRRCVHARC
jgi:hypothetical protein